MKFFCKKEFKINQYVISQDGIFIYHKKQQQILKEFSKPLVQAPSQVDVSYYGDYIYFIINGNLYIINLEEKEEDILEPFQFHTILSANFFEMNENTYLSAATNEGKILFYNITTNKNDSYDVNIDISYFRVDNVENMIILRAENMKDKVDLSIKLINNDIILKKITDNIMLKDYWKVEVSKGTSNFIIVREGFWINEFFRFFPNKIENKPNNIELSISGSFMALMFDNLCEFYLLSIAKNQIFEDKITYSNRYFIDLCFMNDETTIICLTNRNEVIFYSVLQLKLLNIFMINIDTPLKQLVVDENEGIVIFLDTNNESFQYYLPDVKENDKDNYLLLEPVIEYNNNYNDNELQTVSSNKKYKKLKVENLETIKEAIELYEYDLEQLKQRKLSLEQRKNNFIEKFNQLKISDETNKQRVIQIKEKYHYLFIRINSLIDKLDKCKEISNLRNNLDNTIRTLNHISFKKTKFNIYSNGAIFFGKNFSERISNLDKKINEFYHSVND